jgi:adenosylhomocysteine nucleosidase
MPKIAIVAALEREVSGLTKGCSRIEREYEDRKFVFFEPDEMVVVCGGIGLEAARRAAEAVIALYRPARIESVGFAGALDVSLGSGEVFAPAVVIDARDGSRVQIEGGNRQGTLVTFMTVAGIDQKVKLAQAYGGHAVDMEASAVAAAARAYGIPFGATKAISDQLNFEMPEMERFIDPQGRFRTAHFAVFAALRPWLWRRVALLASNSSKAARALNEHMERFRQKLSQASAQPSGKTPAAARPTSQPTASSGLRARGHQ